MKSWKALTKARLRMWEGFIEVGLEQREAGLAKFWGQAQWARNSRL
jgi:hypothetical protein